MHGAATFFDARLNDKDQYPVSAKSGSGILAIRLTGRLLNWLRCIFIHSRFPPQRHRQDHLTNPHSRGGNRLQRPCEMRDLSCTAALHGARVQHSSPAKSASTRSRPTVRRPTIRTAPLDGPWTHQKGGFFHDGRFATLLEVVNHYDAHFNLNLSDASKKDLIEYLKGI